MFVVLPRVGTTEGCQLQSNPDMTQEVSPQNHVDLRYFRTCSGIWHYGGIDWEFQMRQQRLAIRNLIQTVGGIPRALAPPSPTSRASYGIHDLM